jgi:putative DNA primase/helicase
VSLWSDEAGLVVGSHSMGDDSLMRYVGLLNRLWDGSQFERRRRTTKSVSIRGRRLTSSLMMQPVVLIKLLSIGGGASRAMGLVARFMIAWPASTIGSRSYCEPTDGMRCVAKLHLRLRELLDMPLPTVGADMTLDPHVLPLSSKAFKMWRGLHDDIEAELHRTGEFGCIPDIGAKIAENAARIAGVFHVIEHGPGGNIDVSTMEGAAAVSVWHLNEARRVIAANERPQAAADAELLFDWLLREATGLIEPRDILNRGPSALRNRDRRDNAVKELIEKYWVFEVKDGRATRFALNPKLRANR